MNHQDRQAIEQPFGKLAQVEGQAAAPDAEAATFIRSQVANQPSAPYFMAQTIIVQEQALSAAQGRIEQLEQQMASQPAGGGGILASLFGGGQRSTQPPQPQRYAAEPARQSVTGHGQGMMPAMPPGRSGGGFLAGAARTAMGVAGGMMIGNMLPGLSAATNPRPLIPARPMHNPNPSRQQPKTTAACSVAFSVVRSRPESRGDSPSDTCVPSLSSDA